MKSLDENDALLELARTPLLLTLLTLVHTEEGELPQSRALVYNRAIRYMLAETAQWRRQAGGATVASAEMMDLAQHVAYVAHSQLEKMGASFRGLSREQLTEIVADYFRLHEQPLGAAFELTSKKVNAHLTRLIQSNGLLLDKGDNKYSFAHRSFQEFLAGEYFSPGSHHPEALRAAGEAHWREPFRLLAGYGAQEAKNLFYVLKLIEDLALPVRSLSLPPAKPTDPILAGEMLLEIGKEVLSTSGYEHIMSPGGLWPTLSQTLTSLVDQPGVLPSNERIRALNVVGRLGDPRFIDASGRVWPVTERLIQMPSSSVTIGSPLGVGREDERPQRTLRFPDFWIGRYLVTNLEYAEFVEDGGYEKERYWQTAESKKWVVGDRAFLEEVERTWVKTVRDYHAKEIRDREISLSDLEGEARRRCAPRSRPFYWDNPRFNRPNQPVVGINWWEARAFCVWLTEKGHKQGWLQENELLRLPSEFEWERASRDRDDSRVFPWGNQWDHDKGHTREDALNLNEPTPVGAYPQGTWPGGPLDLSGNVWEWLENLKLPYDEKFDSSRGSLATLEDRAIRGSSWYNTPDFARCSSRFVDRPYNLYFDVGFRVLRIDRQSVMVACGTRDG